MRHFEAALVPQFYTFNWPIICALKEMGGSASNAEMVERVAADMKLSEAILAVPHGDSSQSEVEYRIAWARTYLKKLGAINNSERGVWTLTAEGRNFTMQDVEYVVGKPRPLMKELISGDVAGFASNEEECTFENNETGWKEGLLSTLKEMSPGAFERLCQRVLRESGFTKVEVLGRAGDGGIDGAGVLRVNLISFHVRFQCKRWKDLVSSSVIRDFRGALVGRADKGLIITTGRFTPDAQREAVRDGAPAIDLVDGEDLCDLLRNLRLGVSVRTIEVVDVEPNQLKNV